MFTGLIVCAALGAVLGLLGCRTRGSRAWIVHGLMAATMFAMLVPALDPFGALGPVVWTLGLGAAAIWTALAGTPGRVRDLLDLWVMAFLILLMPGLHTTAHTGTPTSTVAGASTGPATGRTVHGEHLLTGADAPGVRGAVLLLIVFWAVGIAVLHRRAHSRTGAAAVAGGLFSAAAMAGMALAG